MLGKEYGRKVTPEDFLAYVYGVLAQPAFTERFADELGTREIRVPMTKDAALFSQVRDVGAKLLWLHTYGQRFVPKGKHAGQVPKGSGPLCKARARRRGAATRKSTNTTTRARPCTSATANSPRRAGSVRV